MKGYNEGLPPLPSDVEVLRAVEYVVEQDVRAKYDLGASANLVAGRLKLAGAKRLGNGAKKGSWSGSMSASVRIAPRLSALARRGLLIKMYDSDNWRNVYILSAKGRATMEEAK